jgi:DNA-binding protein HU-beta
MAMGKFELISYVADAVKITKVDAQKVVEAALDGIKESLTKEEEVRLIGFGSFAVSKSAAKMAVIQEQGKPLRLKRAIALSLELVRN